MSGHEWVGLETTYVRLLLESPWLPRLAARLRSPHRDRAAGSQRPLTHRAAIAIRGARGARSAAGAVGGRRGEPAARAAGRIALRSDRDARPGGATDGPSLRVRLRLRN